MTLRYHTPLSPDEQTSAGLTTPRVLAIADRVRYAELDILNHVNNKAYMTWFETLRVAYFEHMCAPFFDTAAPRLVLRNADVRFVKEMLAGEDYIATCQVTAFRTSSYTVQQELWAGDLRATLTGVLVLLSPDGQSRAPLPAALKAEFERRDGATGVS